MELDGLMFDNFFFPPFSVTVGFLSAKAYVRPRAFDDVVMHEVVKGDLFGFIVPVFTKNWIVLCGSHQYWFYSIAMYKTCMPHDNVMKKIRWEVTMEHMKIIITSAQKSDNVIPALGTVIGET